MSIVSLSFQKNAMFTFRSKPQTDSEIALVRFDSVLGRDLGPAGLSVGRR